MWPNLLNAWAVAWTSQYAVRSYAQALGRDKLTLNNNSWRKIEPKMFYMNYHFMPVNARSNKTVILNKFLIGYDIKETQETMIIDDIASMIRHVLY